MHKALVFDLETTGLPKRCGSKYQPVSNIEAYDSSRVVQIAWVILDESVNRVIQKRCYIIRPDGFEVPVESTNIHHISHAQAVAEGVPLPVVLDIFLSDLVLCDKMVGHNIFFDANILGSECWRCKRMDVTEEMKKKRILDTMKLSRAMLSLVKYPKLEELCGMLLDKPVQQKHDALDDTILCTACYVRLRAMNYKRKHLRVSFDRHIKKPGLKDETCCQPTVNT